MNEKDFIFFGEIMYLESNQNFFLFSRGFIDSDLHLSPKKCVQCEFIFEQKDMQIRQKNQYQKKQPIPFGTEITIKHVFSNFYLSMLTDEDGHEKIVLQKQLSENSMFEMMPLRTFQHKGDHITINSSFAIRHILLKSYIGSNILQINSFKNTIRTDLYHTNLMLKSSHIIRKMNMQEFNHPLFDTKLQKIQSSIVKEQIQNREKLLNYINEYQSENTLMNSTKKLNTEEIQNLCFIPIEIGKNQRTNLMQCAIEKHSHTMWKAQFKSQNHVKYLQDNDYIYFVSSIKNKGTMTVICNEDSNSCVIDFVSQSNEFETECSAIFIVEIQGQDQGSFNQQNIYLKHLLSGRYFPFNEKNLKKKLKLVPLLPVNNLQNKLPPFHIYFQGQFFPKQYIDSQDTCGFWLNKVDRIEINQILSLQGMPYSRWIPYLSGYLDKDRTKRQQLLKQFGILRFMVYYATNKLQESRQIYNLLFKMINQNRRIRKQIVCYISELLKKQKKQYLIDILSEIFNNEDNFIEKYIQPEHLNHQINDFKIQQAFSITYLRIFRLFCGNYSEPCQRNQNLLYKLFFQEKSGLGSEQCMSQSILNINQNKIPDKFKFKLLFPSKTQIQIENSGKNYQFKDFDHEKQSYLRQYFYLLGDCLKKNKNKIQQFKKSHSYALSNLLDVLENNEIEQLHGPILNLINIVYLDPQYKYKLYVYISGYDQMCYKGSLISLQQSEDISRLISFINMKIDQLGDQIDSLQKLKKEASVLKESPSSDELFKLIEEQNAKLIQVYTSTKFKRFLITIKHTINNSYWNNINSLEFIVDTLYKLYITKTDRILDLQSDYQQVHQWKNYLDSTVLIIDIAIIYLDIKINLCISNLISLPEEKVEMEINAFVNDLEINQFHKHLDYFQLCDAENQETMRKSLILSRKYYQIKSIVYKKYNEAMLQRKSTASMREQIDFIKESIENLKSNGHVSIEICKLYIKKCSQYINTSDLQQEKILSNACILISNFKYKKITVEFQILSFKLGVLDILMEDIERYINLRSKQKVVIQEGIYWKLLLVNILIKSNSVIKKQIVELRKLFIQLIVQDNPNSLIAIDILQELYSNNRVIVVSDREQIQQICLMICELIVRDHTCEISAKNIINVKINKLFNLVLTFLIVNGKKIKNNFSLIAGELFDKEIIIVYLYKIKNIEIQFRPSSTMRMADRDQKYNINNDALFQVLLYILTETLEQKPEKLRFTLPQNDQIMGLILAIGRNNWKLTFSIYNLIRADQVEQNESLLKMLRVTINSICQIGLEQYKVKQKQNDVVDMLEGNQELQIIVLHLPILIRIVSFIMEVSVRPTKKKLVPENLLLIKQSYQRKRELIERLFLFRPYLAGEYSQILQKMVQQNLSVLNMDQIEFERMKKISFSDVNLKMIRQSNLGQFVSETQIALSKKGSFLRNMSRRQSNLKNNENIFEWIQQISRITKMKSIKYFSISEAKQFIKSLIFINRSDAEYLDTGLKQFFLNFLINSFPEKIDGYEQNVLYQQQLQRHQKLLIQIQAAELVSILLQQKFKQNYNLFINVFEFGNKLLEGGNEQTQMRFYDIFIKDHKNCIFENITFIIQNSLMGLKFYFRSNDKQNNGRITLKEPIVYPQRKDYYTMKEKKNICEILKKIFRFLQLLCENDNQELKKYIFRQTNDNKVVKYMSVNFLEIAINIYIQLIQIIEFNLLNLMSEQNEDSQFYLKQIIDNLVNIQIFIVDFLIEVCQYPAFQNQFFICQTDFFYSLKKINDFSKTYYQKFEDNKIMFQIERKIAILMRGLLEQKNSQIIESLNKKLHIKDLQDFVISSLSRTNINSRAELIEIMSKNHDKLIDQVENVVDILIVCNALEINIEKDLSDEHCEIIYEIKKQIKEIQVNFKSNLTTLYFCYRPIFNYLSVDTKEYFINKFSLHQSSTQKLKDLITLRHIINQDIVHRKSHQLIMSDRMINFLFSCSTYLCFLLIALQLFFYSVTNVGITLDEIQFGIIKGLSYIQFMISLIYFVMWGLNIGPITKQKLKTKYNFIFNQKDKGWGNGILNYYVLIKQIYWEEGASYHALLLIFISFVSCFYQMRLYSLIILYIFAKIQLLQSLLSAIRLTGGKLLLMCLLSSAFSFIFGVLSINNYIKAIFQNETIDIDIQHISSHCSSILTCIESLYTQRIIGETPNREGDSSHYGRFFSDVVYWAFFEILIPNLTAAIIIDRFAELRNIKQKIQKQEHNACLICFADKSTIQRRNQDFDYHKQTKHCIWNYFFYLYYLEKLKSNTEYTGVEYWIIKQVKDEKVEWFPIDKSQKEEQFSEVKLLSLYEALKKKIEENKSQFTGKIQE